MIKTAICGKDEDQKQIEEVLSQYFKEKNIAFKISLLDDEAFFESLFGYEFHLYISSDKETICYVVKIDNYPKLDKSSGISGTLKFPLTYEAIEENLADKIKSSKICPYEIYTVKNKSTGTAHAVLHRNIEFVHKEYKKSILFLDDGSMEQTEKSIAKIFQELDREYFVKCSRGYIVNIYNVVQISDDWKTLIMKSGAEIPMSRKGYREFLKAFSIMTTGINIFTY